MPTQAASGEESQKKVGIHPRPRDVLGQERGTGAQMVFFILCSSWRRRAWEGREHVGTKFWLSGCRGRTRLRLPGPRFQWVQGWDLTLTVLMSYVCPGLNCLEIALVDVWVHFSLSRNWG